MAIDPVCKMNVDENKAMATSVYKGGKYHFCAVGCKKAFDEDPEYYISHMSEEPEGGECGTGWEKH